MKNLVLAFILLSSFLYCQQINPSTSDDKMTQVSQEDSEMNKIIADARSSFGHFEALLNNHEDNVRRFSVKYPFHAGPEGNFETEHIWLSDVSIEEGKYYGTVNNQPYFIKDIKLGDRVSFEPKLISDWTYIKDDYLVGGKSIIMLLRELTEDERSEILSSLDYKIKEFENNSRP